MNPPDEAVRNYIRKVRAFRDEINRQLGVFEEAPARVYQLDPTYAALGELSVRQDELFRQAIRCVEAGLFRAAHVMAWAGLMDFVEEKLNDDGLAALRALRPKWKADSLEDLRESVPEAQIIDAARELRLCTKNQAKALHGMLNKRNECAHPSEFYPGFNDALGYVSEAFQRVRQLKGRTAI